MIFQNGEISEMGQNEVFLLNTFILLKLRILKKEVRKNVVNIPGMSKKYSNNEREITLTRQNVPEYRPLCALPVKL